MWVNEDLINTGEVSLVGLGCSREVEGGRVIDSWEGVVQGGVEADEGEMEGSSWILWLDGAGDVEAVVLKQL